MNQIVSEKRYIQERLGIPYENLSQSYLRAETLLTNQSQYSFLLQRGQTTTPLVTERLLQLNDQFVITHFTLGLKYIASDTPTDTQHLTAQVQTWCNPLVFTAVNTSNADALYNGSFSWTIDRKQYLPAFPIRAFQRIPQAQQGVLGGTGGVTTQADGFDNGLYGFYPSEPTLIDGRQTIDISAELGASVTIDGATASSVYAVLEVRGYLVVNAKS
jgi:hypothetical protein